MAGIVGAVGAHGHGKTLCLMKVVRSAARAGVPVRIADHWWSYAAGATYGSVAAYRAAVARTGAAHRVVSFRPAVPGASEGARALALHVAELVTRSEGGLFVLDEIDELVPPRAPLPDPIARAALRGNRLPQTSFAWGTQRPANVHPSIRSQTDILYVFRLVEQAALRWLRENLGPWGDEVAAAAPTLAKLEAIAVPILLEGRGLDRFRLEPEPADFAGRALG